MSHSQLTRTSTSHSRTGTLLHWASTLRSLGYNIHGYRLFKEKPIREPLLLIYRDEPCVVIGRNQNPWKEVNFPALRRANIPFVRRRSGGGTVYHVMPSCLMHDLRRLTDCGEGYRKYKLLRPSSARLVQSPCYRAACLTRRALT